MLFTMQSNKKLVLLPVENLQKLWPKDLTGKRIGAVLHPASICSNFEHSLTELLQLDGELFSLTTLFGPQHGIKGYTQDNMIEWEGGVDPDLNIPVFSLYGEHREPTDAMYSDLDVVLIDLQDVGARYYTFIWTMYLCMKSAERLGKTVVVCDRPNPINCVDVEGPTLELDHTSFVGLHSIPVRHGKNIGDLAQQFKEECFPQCDLRVLPMEHYEKSMWFDETGLPWVLPSPNMPTLDTATVYPGMCLFEATNVSEGRGTTKPFELFGAPFIDAVTLCTHLNDLKLDGVYFREAYFQPTFHKWAGEMCGGAQFHVTDRNTFRSFTAAVEILKYLHKEYPNEFKWRTEPYEYEYDKLAIDILLGNGWFREKSIEG